MNIEGQQIIVISNHFNSKGGDEPLFGPEQAPTNGSEVQRLQQGSGSGGLRARHPDPEPTDANIIVTGDLNDFQFASSLAPLYAAGLTNLVNTLPEGERYTYNYQGNAQSARPHVRVVPTCWAPHRSTSFTPTASSAPRCRTTIHCC
jgi:predicted extracellular nuclease